MCANMFWRHFGICCQKVTISCDIYQEFTLWWGYLCDEVINLDNQKSPPYVYNGDASTHTMPDELEMSCGGVGGEQVFSITIPAYFGITIWQPRYTFPNVVTAYIGRECYGEKELWCSRRVTLCEIDFIFWSFIQLDLSKFFLL